jgi:predicted GIY-YIG superfamily endonuclease
MNTLEKDPIINGQSAAKPVLNQEGSETISRKESRLDNYLSEKPDIIIENLFSIRKFSKICCIYCIFSKSRMIPYIGSTVNLQRRIQKHREALRKKSHFSKYLQNIFNIESEKDIFVFIIEECNINNIQEKEYYWINYFDAVKNGLNATYDTQRNFVNESIKQIIKQKNSKPILMFTKNGELIKEFTSVKNAALFVNDQSTNISACCNQKLRWVKGFVFRYKNTFKKFDLRESNRGTYNKEHLSLCKKLTSKRVICNNIIYDSISEAERKNNIPRGTLNNYIKNNKQYKNLLFTYYEDIVHS